MILDCNGGSPKGDHMTDTTSELLPCPFCAGEAELEKEDIHFPGRENDLWAVVCRNGDCPAGNMVQDGEMGGFMHSWKRDEAIELWNTRPVMPDDALWAACEGLLAFIRSKYPEDFKPGGQGFTCPHHKAIADLIEDEERE